MATTVKIEPIADWINVTVSKTLSPEAQKQAIADFARERLDEAQNANRAVLGQVPPHKTFVDGRAGAALETVRPDGGTIVFEFELVGELLAWILTELRRRSPVLSGAYRAGHRLFADGREIEVVAGAGIVPPAEEYAFINLVPYARKIEIGKTGSGRNFVIQVPNRIYERTAQDARRRFGNLVKINFTYRSPILSYGGAPSRRGGLERATRSPAIIVTPR